MSVISINENKNKNERTIIDTIELVMDNYKDKSINTYKTYMSNYREFFLLTIDREMEYVTWGDLLSIGYEDILKYRVSLKEKGNINRTINMKMASLSTLYNELYKINREVDTVVVSPTRLTEVEENNTYGSLTEEEVDKLIKFCEELPQSRNPKQKALYFKMAYITAIRQGALLKMEWKDITPIVENGRTEGMVITLKDKGKINRTPITKDLYDELLEVKEENIIQDGRVFPTTRKTLTKALDDFCVEEGIDRKKRGIVLHSLKKASIDKVYHETGDINITARHGNHESVEMVYQTYEGKNNQLLDKPSFTVFNKDSKENIRKTLQNMDKYDIIEAIVSSGAKVGEAIIQEVERRN